MRALSALILAAGGSTRLGQPKQLLPLGSESFVRRAVRLATEVGCAPVLVVVGEQAALIEAELRGTPAQLVPNPNWRRGIGSSLRCGVAALPADASAVLVLACDQPLVTSGVIAALIAEREASGKPIAACGYADTLGIPALFNASFFPVLCALPNGSGAKRVLEQNRHDVAVVPFEPARVDIDTPADLERFKAAQRSEII